MSEDAKKLLREVFILVFVLVFGGGMFLWGLESRSVENYVCVTYARENGYMNPPYRGFSWVSNISCQPNSPAYGNFSCGVGDMYLYQRAVVLDPWVQDVR